MANLRKLVVGSLGVAALGLISVSLGACSSCKGVGSSTRDDLALLPRESTVLVTVNFARMRDTAVWRKLLDLRDSSDEGKKKYAELVAECGFDPFTSLESATIAFPPPGEGGEFGAIVHGKFDEVKLAACIVAQSRKAGAEVVPEEYLGKKVYGDRESGMVGSILDAHTIVIAGHDWSRKIIDRFAGKAPEGSGSLKDNAALVELSKKPRTSDALWAVGVVPEQARKRLEEMPSLATAKTLKDVFGSMDFAGGLKLDVTLELGSESDARELAVKLNEQLVEVKKNPQVMMLGVTSLLEAVKVTSEGPAFKILVNYNQSQVDQLVERLTGLLKGGAQRMMGGGGMPPMPPGSQGSLIPPTDPPSLTPPPKLE